MFVKTHMSVVLHVLDQAVPQIIALVRRAVAAKVEYAELGSIKHQFQHPLHAARAYAIKIRES